MPAPATITVNKSQLQQALVQVRGAISDRTELLKICGELMRTSIARTFREEGSPAGSWPELAPSTRRNKKYTTGHKLLILSGRLFNSISYTVEGDALTIGTDVKYAAVHQFGSRDFAAGPRTLAQSRATAAIGAYSYLHLKKLRSPGVREIEDSRGRVRGQRTAYQGPRHLAERSVRAHSRHQNIPPRPFLVFRPEDPDRMTGGIEQYLARRSGGAMEVSPA